MRIGRLLRFLPSVHLFVLTVLISGCGDMAVIDSPLGGMTSDSSVQMKYHHTWLKTQRGHDFLMESLSGPNRSAPGIALGDIRRALGNLEQYLAEPHAGVAREIDAEYAAVAAETVDKGRSLAPYSMTLERLRERVRTELYVEIIVIRPELLNGGSEGPAPAPAPAPMPVSQEPTGESPYWVLFAAWESTHAQLAAAVRDGKAAPETYERLERTLQWLEERQDPPNRPKFVIYRKEYDRIAAVAGKYAAPAPAETLDAVLRDLDAVKSVIKSDFAPE